jgi:hypothetical protein
VQECKIHHLAEIRQVGFPLDDLFIRRALLIIEYKSTRNRQIANAGRLKFNTHEIIVKSGRSESPPKKMTSTISIGNRTQNCR